MCSKLAQHTKDYCRYGSSTTCKICHALRPRPFQAMDVKRGPSAEISGATYCFCSSSTKKSTSIGSVKEGRRHLVPQPDDVPEHLRGHTREVIEALRPLDVDVSEPMGAPSDSVQHKTMVRIGWSALGGKCRPPSESKHRRGLPSATTLPRKTPGMAGEPSTRGRELKISSLFVFLFPPARIRLPKL